MILLFVIKPIIAIVVILSSIHPYNRCRIYLLFSVIHRCANEFFMPIKWPIELLMLTISLFKRCSFGWRSAHKETLLWLAFFHIHCQNYFSLFECVCFRSFCESEWTMFIVMCESYRVVRTSIESDKNEVKWASFKRLLMRFVFN